jgi:hypothetical protein
VVFRQPLAITSSVSSSRLDRRAPEEPVDDLLVVDHEAQHDGQRASASASKSLQRQRLGHRAGETVEQKGRRAVALRQPSPTCRSRTLVPGTRSRAS